MVGLVVEHRVRPVAHHGYDLADGPRALAELASGDQFGKLVVAIG
ncbi:hypothetical protein GCM10027360_67790 [Amycolatopsis echigonensis]|nr:hypothetical protein [Amycolatopsis niigatensis]